MRALSPTRGRARALVGHDWRRGSGGGLSLTLAGRGAYSIQPEVLYVSKGTSLGEGTLTDAAGNHGGSPPDRLRYTFGLTKAGNPSFSETARNGDLLVMAGVAFHP